MVKKKSLPEICSTSLCALTNSCGFVQHEDLADLALRI